MKRPPLHDGDQVVSLLECPDCEGRGWRLINPYGSDHISNKTQCVTCFDAHDHWMKTKELPAVLIKRINAKLHNAHNKR